MCTQCVLCLAHMTLEADVDGVRDVEGDDLFKGFNSKCLASGFP